MRIIPPHRSAGQKIPDHSVVGKRGASAAFDPETLRIVIELQEKSYRLLRWVSQRVKTGTIDFGVAHEAMSNSDAAEDWIGRHLENLPHDLRPQPGLLKEFASLFASYLTTSFELVEKPRERLKSGCGCYCPICTYLVLANHLRVRKPSKKARQSALELKRLYLRSLARDVGITLAPGDTTLLLNAVEIERDLSLATYGHEFVRRSQFASQGEGVLVLWREIAWKEGPRRIDGKRTYLGLKEGFQLQGDEILRADQRIAERIDPARWGMPP